MPNPAILFVWLCVIVIIVSALLAWADIKVTYQVVEAPPVAVEEVVQGGSTQPSGGLPDASVQEGDYGVVEKTAAVQSLLSADGIRFLFTSFVANFRNFAAVAIILVVMIGVGLAEAAGPDRGADPQARHRLVGGDADADHHLHRRPLEHRFGRRISRADTPGCGCVQERRPQSARRHGGRVRGCRRRVRRQLPDHAARRRPDRDHERRERARRPRPLDRPRGEPVLRHRLDDPGHDRPDARLRADRREEPRKARPRARERRRVAGRRQGARGIAGSRGAGPPLRTDRDRGRPCRDRAAHRPPGRAAPPSRDGRHHRRLAVHGQPDRDHHDHLLRGGAGLRSRRRDDPDERRGARVDHEVVGGARDRSCSSSC